MAKAKNNKKRTNKLAMKPTSTTAPATQTPVETLAMIETALSQATRLTSWQWKLHRHRSQMRLPEPHPLVGVARAARVAATARHGSGKRAAKRSMEIDERERKQGRSR